MPEPDIKSLFDVANEVVDEFATVLRTTLKIAKRGGDALNAIKEATPHGEFTNALKIYFKGSVETARIWMKVARDWDWLVQLYDGDIDNVTIDGARAALARKETIETRAEKGEMKFTPSADRIRRDVKRGLAEYIAMMSDRDVEILGYLWRQIWEDDARGILSLVKLRFAEDTELAPAPEASTTTSVDDDDWGEEESTLAHIHGIADRRHAEWMARRECWPPRDTDAA